MHIAARTEIAAVWGKNNGFDVVFIVQIAKPVAQFGIAVKRQRVFTLWSIKRKCGDAVFNVAVKVLCLAAHVGSLL